MGPEPARPLLKGGAIALAALVLDQVSKWGIVTQVMTPPRTLELTPFANIVLVHNTGVSFGMLNDGNPWNAWLLSGFALAVCAGLVFWLSRADTRIQIVGLGLILGGAIGNVIDRITLGAVVDFLDFHVGGYHWPAFNVADSAICIGAVLLIYEAFFRRSQNG